MGRRARGAEVRWSRVAQVSRPRMASHVAWIRKNRMRVMGCRVMLRQAMVGLMARLLVERRRAAMLKRGSVMVGIIGVRSLALLARMRLLWRIVDIVVRCYTVVARQCASDTWVPPERTALAGRRALNGKNLVKLSPAGLRREWLRRAAWFEASPECREMILELVAALRWSSADAREGAGHMRLRWLRPKGDGKNMVLEW